VIEAAAWRGAYAETSSKPAAFVCLWAENSAAVYEGCQIFKNLRCYSSPYNMPLVHIAAK